MRKVAANTRGGRFAMRHAEILCGMSWMLLCAVAPAQQVQQSRQSTSTSGFTIASPRTAPGGPMLQTNGLSVALEKRDGAGLHGYHECELSVAALSPRRDVRV
ncbi:MAG TPA: hypothetical protein VHV77_07635, partial [Pirellulales bacterium]|nr:hypothetical protein [Pirellulales bacterium]